MFLRIRLIVEERRMANILITYFSDYGETMYDAISDYLLSEGNNVIRFNIKKQANDKITRRI